MNLLIHSALKFEKNVCLTLRWQTIPQGQAPPRVKPKPMYVIFHVEFNGIARNIDFRPDITMKISKKDGTIFCLISVQRGGVIIADIGR